MMLKQILQDMYIDAELLSELSDDQKQILFCKMREEQVRRWKEREEKILEKEEEEKRNKIVNNDGRPSRRQVHFLKAVDGNDWVWVMGEHKDDRSIEQILEGEAQQRAREQAAEILRIEEERLAAKEAAELALMRAEEEAEAQREKDLVQKALKDSERAAIEAEAKRLAEQAEIERKNLERRRAESMAAKRRKLQEEMALQRRESKKRIQQRESQIFSSFKEVRARFEKIAAEEVNTLDRDWRASENKAKAAELELRAIARKAREEHRHSISIKSAVQPLVQSANDNSRPPRPPKPQITLPAIGKVESTLLFPIDATLPGPGGPTPRPRNRTESIDWWRRSEKSRFSYPPPEWLHGCISRSDAEALLEDMAMGSFLVRVSERIFGYAVSYRAATRCKHFLVEVTVCKNAFYQFFGANNVKQHDTLMHLVEFHKNNPVSLLGGELLQVACGQDDELNSDWHELYEVVAQEDENTSL